MKLLTFNYQKTANKTTQRTLISLKEPGNLYFGIDISELDEVDKAEVALAIEEVQKEYFDKVAYIMKQYDITTMYRNFDPEKMSDVLAEEL